MTATRPESELSQRWDDWAGALILGIALIEAHLPILKGVLDAPVGAVAALVMAVST